MSTVIKHSGDQAVNTFFVPAGTQWPATVKDVQSALALIGPWARTDVGLKDASATEKGIAMLATQADVDTGTNNTKIITPQLLEYKLKKPQASETVYGTTRYSNPTERMDATNFTTSLTPKGIHDVLDRRIATEAKTGTMKIATMAVAQAGTDDILAMTAKKVKAAIDALVPIQGTATETAKGVVKIATLQETVDGVSREGTAVSPYSFSKANATENKFGTIKIATAAEMRSTTIDNVAVTPKKLNAMRATGSDWGLTILAANPDPNKVNQALAVNANVVPGWRQVNGMQLTNDITITAGHVNAWTKEEADGRYLQSSLTPAGCLKRVKDQAWDGNPYFQVVSNGRYYHFIVETETYFEAWDGSNDRWCNFDVWVNGQKVGMIGTVLEYYKGGSRGHSWRYRGWGPACGGWDRWINPGDRIEVTKQGGYMDLRSLIKITLCS